MKTGKLYTPELCTRGHLGSARSGENLCFWQRKGSVHKNFIPAFYNNDLIYKVFLWFILPHMNIHAPHLELGWFESLVVRIKA